MDQDNTKGQDKRNWRERLGIGAQGNKDLPKISDDFKKEAAPAAPRPVAAGAARPAPRPAVSAAPAVKPAPMAPRANPKAINPPSPVPPDRLAERLRSQREASTKLAEQRVQVARQRAEAQVAAAPPAAPASVPPATPGAPKPKFTFAEEGQQAKQAVAPPPVMPKPQIMPPRAPLGGAPSGPPPVSPLNTQRPAPAYVPPQGGYVPQQPPPAFQPQYNPQPVPPYRPIDPSTGLPSAGGYVPPRSFSVPPPTQQPGFQAGPRLNVPPRVPAAPTGGYVPPPEYPDYNAGGRVARPDPRVAPAAPQNSDYEGEFYDEMPPVRGGRPTSTDYKQAYREAEYGYEEEAPRSKAPWILAGLLLLALLVAGGGVWFYQSSIKPLMTGQSGTQDVPAVAAPETPAKVQAEQPAASQPPAAASPTKKQIYDRIVGDQEVLGGEVTPPAEQPAAIPEPTNAGEAPAQPAPAGSGEDAAPLPIPPPPGGAGDQQGSLAPDNGKQSSEVVTAAAGESQAAVAAQDLPVPPAPPATPAAVAPAAPPAPGEVDKARSILEETKAPDTTAPVAEAETEKIVDSPPPPASPKKKAATPVKKVVEKAAEKKLGSKPVVLVPPAKKATTKVAGNAAEGEAVTDGGLYGDQDITVAPAQPVQPQAPAAAPKKKKTLADLFSNSDEEAGGAAVEADPVPAAPAPAPKKVASVEQAPVAPKPAPEQASAGGGFVVQLASFRSREEASREFGRLKAKHGAALAPYTAIITEASVGGSTRYRLSAGRMGSQAQANSVCSSLFAKGERDCLVKKQ